MMHGMFILSLHMFNPQRWTIGKRILWQYMVRHFMDFAICLRFFYGVWRIHTFFPNIALSCHNGAIKENVHVHCKFHT